MSLVSRRHLWFVVLVAALVVQVYVLYVPQAPGPAVTVPGTDKVVHLLVFAAVTYAGLRAGLRPGLVVGYGFAQALLSEALQHTLLPERTGDPLDLLADVVGVAAAVAVNEWRRRNAPGPSDPSRSRRR